MIQVNLIPDSKIDMIRSRMMRFRIISICIVTSIVSLSLVVLLAIYTYGGQALADTRLNDQIKSESEKINSVKDINKLLTIQNQLATIPKIEKTKNMNSRIFDLVTVIKKASGGVVSFSNIAVDTEKSNLQMSGQVPGYSSYEIFIKTLQNTYVQYTENKDSKDFKKKILASNLIFSQITYGQSAFGVNVLTFNFSLTYAKELFDPTVYNVSTTVDKSGNVTDSYLGLPTSLFSDGM